MYIYDKKDNLVDLYFIEPKKQDLKEFKEKILKEKEKEAFFYYLSTNSSRTFDHLYSEDCDIEYLRYDTGEVFDMGNWSIILKMSNSSDIEKNAQRKILENYINGKYASLTPTRVFERLQDKKTESDIYRFLIFETPVMVNQLMDTCNWRINNLFNLPRDLYLLQLLENGNFSKLISEDIEEQLHLFELNYLRSVTLSDISDMIEAGLVKGNMNQFIYSAEANSAILRKIINKQ